MLEANRSTEKFNDNCYLLIFAECDTQASSVLQYLLLWGQAEVKGKLCYRFFYLIPFRGYSIFTPLCLVDVTPWTRKAQKELYERR